MKFIFSSLFLVLLIFFGFPKGEAMSMFFKGKEVEAVLFSPLEGRITYNGEPASGAKISVWVAWKDQEGQTDHYEADDNGYFSLPRKVVMYRDSPLSELSVGQKITVSYKGKEFIIWNAGKSNGELYGELGGKPLGVVCELTREESDRHLDFSLLETVCTWESVESVKED